MTSFGLQWGQSRSYANILSDNSLGANGNSWLTPQLKALAFVDVPFGQNDPAEICVVEGANSSIWFQRQGDGTYQPLFNDRDSLIYDSANLQFVLTTAAGRQFVFFDNSSGQPQVMAGLLKAVIDRSGRIVTATYDGDGRLVRFDQQSGEQASSFVYAYVESGDLAGRLASVTLVINGVQVKRSSYTYYDGEAGGSLGDLKGVLIERYDTGTGAWTTINRKHSRYYVSGDTNGFVHGLKFLVRGTAYQRMVDAGLDPETAPEATLANYANFYFEYDSQQRVSRERVQGGRREFSFSYETNPTVPGLSDVNTWFTKTVETLPDGNENRVYTNEAGQVILKIFKETATGNQWYAYAQFDAGFHTILQANSFAVASVTEPTSGSPTLTVNLKPSDGLITENVFYPNTDPSSGAVAGYLQQVTVKKGSDGSPTIIRKVEYDTQQAFGQTIYPTRAELAFPLGDNNEAHADRTSYSYAWYTDGSGNPTFQLQQMVTTYPAVSPSQNGDNQAGQTTTVFNLFGQRTWFLNQRGAISFMAYDAATNALVQQVDDVDTAQMTGVPSGWQTVAGWGAQLVTDYVSDEQGRTVRTLGPWVQVQLKPADTTTTPIRRVKYKVYLDEALEVRDATGYMTGGGLTASYVVVGAVGITRFDEGNNVIDQIQSVRICTCGPLSSDESFPQEKWSRWTHNIYDTWGRLYGTRVYFKIPPQGEGDANANYLETSYGYDIMGRQIRVLQSSGTVVRTVRDARGLVTSNWVGTDDRGATPNDPSGSGTPGNNMMLVSAQQYDDGTSGGDGNLTLVTKPVDTNTANDRIVSYGYDYRDRRITVTQSNGVSMTWVSLTVYDNLDRPLENSTFDGSVSGMLIAENRTFYDALGRVYRQEVDGVNPDDGDVTQTLVSQNWYDLASNLIKSSQAGATSFTKTVYDALNRVTVNYVGCVPGTAGVPAGDDNDVSTDTILEQNETTYDRDGSVIQALMRQRFDDAVGTGALRDVNNEPKARVSYVAYWPDGIGRVWATADYGTNGGAALVRPDVAPARSDTVLVSTNHFKDNGDANATIDPMGIATRWENDQAGRRIKLIENFVEGCPDKSRISEYAWHASGQLQRLTLSNSDTGNQVTNWIYGTTLFDSEVADANLLRAKIYPESDDRPSPLDAGPDGVYARLEYSYSRQGQAVTFTDADETVHSYSYDKLGRLLADAATALGPDVDGAVRRIERAYEKRGMLALVTSYDAVAAGSIVNQSAFTYDAFANLTEDQQSSSGEVASGTPAVIYVYADGSTNTVRKISTTYPDGKVLNVQYGTENSVDDHFNRVTALQFEGESSPLVEYKYVGVAWQIRVGYPQPAVELTYKKEAGQPVGDAGDPYNGYDRFGRTQDIRWQKIDS